MGLSEGTLSDLLGQGAFHLGEPYVVSYLQSLIMLGPGLIYMDQSDVTSSYDGAVGCDV